MSDLVAIIAAILIDQGWTCPQPAIDAATAQVAADEREGQRWAVRGVLGLVRREVCHK